jgi:hypothetical protein
MESNFDKKIQNVEQNIGNKIIQSINNLPQRLLSEEAKKSIKDSIIEEIKNHIDTIKNELQGQIDELKNK